MSRNGSGSYSLPQPAFVPGTTISSSAVNSDFADIAAALTQSISADGQTTITGPLKTLSGSFAAPAWTFSTDQSTGVWLNGAGTLGLEAAGVGVLISSTGSNAASATVAAGGGSYAVNDTITLAGGSAMRPAVLQVASLSGSAVASVTVLDAGLYAVTPTNPVSQASTSGGGSSATFNVTWNTDNYIADYDGTTISTLWADMGATSYMAGAMNVLNGLALANYIGASNITAAVISAVPLPNPQGRLTLTSNTPVLVSDASAQGTIYWTPFNGLWTPIHNGTSLIPIQLSGQLPFVMSGSQLANQIYDVFLCYNGNVPVIGVGPSWSAGSGGSITAGSCARGTGAGGTALTRLLGFYVNAAQVSVAYNNGSISGTLTVPANQAFYLGSVFMDGTNGQASCLIGYGQSRKWAIFNAFNRVPTCLKAGDSGNWTYNTATIRAANGSSANSLTIFSGLAEEIYDIRYNQLSRVHGNLGAASPYSTGIGYNSITAFTGMVAQNGVGGGNSQNTTTINSWAQYIAPPALGINVITALESQSAGATSATDLFGTETNMVLQAFWRT